MFTVNKFLMVTLKRVLYVSMEQCMFYLANEQFITKETICSRWWMELLWILRSMQ